MASSPSPSPAARPLVLAAPHEVRGRGGQQLDERCRAAAGRCHRTVLSWPASLVSASTNVGDHLFGRKAPNELFTLSTSALPFLWVIDWCYAQERGICTVEGTALSVNSIPNTDPEKDLGSDMVRECNRAVYEAEIEDERRMKNIPTFHGFTYSGESSDDEYPNEAYYYTQIANQRTDSSMRVVEACSAVAARGAAFVRPHCRPHITEVHSAAACAASAQSPSAALNGYDGTSPFHHTAYAASYTARSATRQATASYAASYALAPFRQDK
ncbi:uncharacterized protein LOC120692964 isoform X3 [Panicum virgatum]|uniref:uncharacterized protein LOC120692964 isoform X3 n=1 Tax=Panicum virgatum TaxID=38727 RepID=UPI0019D585EE|nr:uncharacterized protein LOC120692964 isoform X3 [Panicum virgatum]